MQRNLVALLYNPWPKSLDRGGSTVGRIVGRFSRALFSNANPRTEEYMLALCGERWPEVRVVRVNDADWLDAVGGADIVVLLYPDAIGQGFAAVEREVLRRKKRWAEVRVLNSRRRCFLLSPTVRRGLRARRFLERTMLAEWLFLALFMVGTPILLAIDWGRGRR